jgi:hypothetical protein
MDAGDGRQLFSVDSLKRQAARGHNVFTSMAAGSDVIFPGTSGSWLVLSFLIAVICYFHMLKFTYRILLSVTVSLACCIIYKSSY